MSPCDKTTPSFRVTSGDGIDVSTGNAGNGLSRSISEEAFLEAGFGFSEVVLPSKLSTIFLVCGSHKSFCFFR